jgi:glutathione S-transferase
MKLFDSSSSPFVRKVNVVIHALGLDERIERLGQSAHPVQRDPHLVRFNPLGQVPALVLDDGEVLADSRVICEYLNHLGGGDLFPASGAARWRALRLQSLADGLLDAAILIRYERHARPPERVWPGWIDAQWAKVLSALHAMDDEASAFGDRFDIGTLACGCALGYLDFRFEEQPWRESHPSLAAWYGAFHRHPALMATRPRPRT